MFKLIYWLFVSADFRLRFFNSHLEAFYTNYYTSDTKPSCVYKWRYKRKELLWVKSTQVSAIKLLVELVSEKRSYEELSQKIIHFKTPQEHQLEETAARISAHFPEGTKIPPLEVRSKLVAQLTERLPEYAQFEPAVLDAAVFKGTDLRTTMPAMAGLQITQTEMVIQILVAHTKEVEAFLCDCIKQIAYQRGVRMIRGEMERNFVGTFVKKGFIEQYGDEKESTVNLCYPVSKRRSLWAQLYKLFLPPFESMIEHRFFAKRQKTWTKQVDSTVLNDQMAMQN